MLIPSFDNTFEFTLDDVRERLQTDRDFARIASLQTAEAGTVVADSARPLQNYTVILDGSLHAEANDAPGAFSSKDRQRLFVLPFTPGAVLGPGLFEGWDNYRLRAATRVTVCELVSDLNLISELCPEVLEAILDNQIRFQQDLYTEQLESHDTIRTRLARLLLRLSDNGRDSIETTHSDLAQRLGTYRETVSNQLASLKAMGLIHSRYKEIEVLRADGLMALSENWDILEDLA